MSSPPFDMEAFEREWAAQNEVPEEDWVDIADHTPLRFGKYMGLTPWEIAQMNPAYIVWMNTTFERDYVRSLCSSDLFQWCAELLDAFRWDRERKDERDSIETAEDDLEGSLEESYLESYDTDTD